MSLLAVPTVKNRTHADERTHYQEILTLSARAIDRTFSGQQYERHGVRLTPSKLARTLYRAGYERTHLCLLGNPPFRWQLYESSDKKLPWYAYLWVAFNKVTDNGPLLMLKEIMMFEAIK
jgi:hypothetical protein